MAAKDTPTMEIPLRAAKGVSRFFLFEALRTGCDEIEITSSQLGSARDKAEKILTRESTPELEFESLIQDVLSSCAKSLQTHAAIVEAVAETMRGDVDDSNENGGKTLNKFALLVAQIKDAAAGVEQLRDVNSCHVTRKVFAIPGSDSPLQVDKEDSPPLPTESDFDSEPEVLSSKKSKTREPKETTLPKKKTKTKHASNTSASVKETSGSDVADEKPIEGTGKKLSKPSELSNSPAPYTQEIPPATPQSAPKQQNFIDDDDINAEVDARLAAKELKRAKKKEAKKRKRDSVASDIFSPEPKAEPAHVMPLPARKKARIDKDDGDVKAKRQNLDDAQESKVKVKKQKTSGPAEKEDKNVEANKAKRRRSSNMGVTDAPAAAPQANNRNKKRKVGF
ncbi:hypothetical protein E4T44_01412 [Aureobasidium sp. EXF-8845]|nr:hypothetical protein E4T44_01412 [Aureobasidium sp. EXF-8845]KAI4856492.1 hypothetical protein E4T45_02048 [Aureobasidium sp. EXF-8846]